MANIGVGGSRFVRGKGSNGTKVIEDLRNKFSGRVEKISSPDCDQLALSRDVIVIVIVCVLRRGMA